MYSIIKEDERRGGELVALQEKLIKHYIGYDDFLSELKEIYVSAIDRAVNNDFMSEVKVLNEEYKEKYEDWHYRYFRDVKPAEFEPIKVETKEL